MKEKRELKNPLSGFIVKKLIYPNAEYWLGREVSIVDEGSLYRIDGTHIFDKVDILSIEEEPNQIRIRMKKMDVLLVGK